ncbi:MULTISPECIES: hypothetical protein [Isoptericola]|uniref:hypothetical protein n=1 Tax=Isoptericola TaxID=254250 RepID=UPI00383BC415
MDLMVMLALFVHILGAAALVGGWFARFRTPTVTMSQFVGGWVQLASGVALVGLAESADGDVNHMKIGVKLVVLVAVLVAAWIGRSKIKRDQTVPVGLAHAVGGLSLVNVALAVFW